LYKQAVDSLLLHIGIYAWAWKMGGRVTSTFGYGPEYEVSTDSMLFFVLIL